VYGNELPNSSLKAGHVLGSQGMVYKNGVPRRDMRKRQGTWENIHVRCEMICRVIAYAGIDFMHHSETVSDDVAKFKLCEIENRFGVEDGDHSVLSLSILW
jgi:ribosomal protein S4E